MKTRKITEDTKLVKFVAASGEDGMPEVSACVKFRFDLSRGQRELLRKAAGEINYAGYSTLDDWITAVIEKAESSPKWYDKPGVWKFWEDIPCLTLTTHPTDVSVKT